LQLQKYYNTVCPGELIPVKDLGVFLFMNHRPVWYLITSEEIEKIQKNLSGIEQTLTEKNLDSARQIADIIETVERRLA